MHTSRWDNTQRYEYNLYVYNAKLEAAVDTRFKHIYKYYIFYLVDAPLRTEHCNSDIHFSASEDRRNVPHWV